MQSRIPLTEVKARLSEIVRTVRRNRDRVTITVDGEPAAVIIPVVAEPARLTEQETATARALFESLIRLSRNEEPFDAVSLIRDGRR